MKTFILTILKPDGSLYWKEHFNTQETLNNWLTEEKTRPYWDSEFTCSIEIVEQHEIDMTEIMAEIEAKRNSAKLKLKALGLTDEEISALLGV